jgi:riboflavin kinase/FMN adenylyltransferase
VDGRVVHGDARGEELGFPTANVRMDGFLLPRPGVYAVRAGIDEGAETQWFDGAANFGTRPQFDGEESRLEVFLMDFSGDLYGRTLRVSFVAYIRPEAAFDSVAALIKQMERDVIDARARLKASP